MAAAVGLALMNAPQLAQQWERAVVLRFGRFVGLRGPGLFWILPFVDRVSTWIDQRTITTSFAAEQTLTSDTVPVNVDAVLFWMVHDAEKAALEVQDYEQAISWAAQTALRDIIGRTTLTDLLRGRERIEDELQQLIDRRSNPWGVTVSSVEMRDVVIPGALQDAMSREAQAAREKQARIILGEAELAIAHSFAEAAKSYHNNPTALHLRAMNMLYEGLKEKGALMLVPSSALDSMGMGGLMGAAALRQSTLTDTTRTDAERRTGDVVSRFAAPERAPRATSPRLAPFTLPSFALFMALLVLVLLLGVLSLARGASAAQAVTAWTDPSPHQVRFVDVAPGVTLEVLDWGGTGRDVVLLTGSGHTAHVYDEFALKLKDCCHVYGITRRGYGASSIPETGYDEPSLSNDVWTVIQTLGLKAPVLIGHSMAGAELTGVGMLHSDRLGGLVYLDAIGDSTDDPPDDPTWKALQAKLPPSGPPPTCTERSVDVRRVSRLPRSAVTASPSRRAISARASRRPRTGASGPRARPAGCRAPSARAGRRATTRRSRCRCSPSPMPSTSISRT